MQNTIRRIANYTIRNNLNRIYDRILFTSKPIKNQNPWSQLKWISSELFTLNDFSFDLVSWGSPRKVSKDKKFVLVKDPSFSTSLARILHGFDIKKFLEFGIYQGGSIVLFDRLYNLDKIIGIDERTSAPALNDYIQEKDTKSIIFPYYNTDQANRVFVNSKLCHHFPNKDIDLIIDDSSHLYEQTLTSFEISFPYLREGGIYIIEDWGWAHWQGEFQKKDFFHGRPLSALIFELVMVQATYPDIISRIDIDFHHVAIVKGSGYVEPLTFKVKDFFLTKEPIMLGNSKN